MIESTQLSWCRGVDGESPIWGWLRDNSSLLAWMFGLSLGSLVLVALLLPMFVLRLPVDYFLASRQELAEPRGTLQWGLHIGKRVLGVVFILVGIVMLVGPGQGLLTIFIGLLLVNFPGKRALERRLVRRPAILALLNRLRARYGREPLRFN